MTSKEQLTLLADHPEVDFWGLTEQDHVDAKIADVMMETEREFKPLAAHLVERYYGTRENYISALEEQATAGLAEIEAKDAPPRWRLNRLIGSVVCGMKARLEREAIDSA